jgi:hypothetical protein
MYNTKYKSAKKYYQIHLCFETEKSAPDELVPD